MALSPANYGPEDAKRSTKGLAEQQAATNLIRHRRAEAAKGRRTGGRVGLNLYDPFEIPENVPAAPAASAAPDITGKAPPRGVVTREEAPPILSPTQERDRAIERAHDPDAPDLKSGEPGFEEWLKERYRIYSGTSEYVPTPSLSAPPRGEIPDRVGRPNAGTPSLGATADPITPAATEGDLRPWRNPPTGGKVTEAFLDGLKEAESRGLDPANPWQISEATAREPGLPGVEGFELKGSTLARQRKFAKQYLTALLKKYDGNMKLALSGWNHGMGKTADHTAEAPMVSTTEELFARVTEAMASEDLKAAFGGEAPVADVVDAPKAGVKAPSVAALKALTGGGKQQVAALERKYNELARYIREVGQYDPSGLPTLQAELAALDQKIVATQVGTAVLALRYGNTVGANAILSHWKGARVQLQVVSDGRRVTGYYIWTRDAAGSVTKEPDMITVSSLQNFMLRSSNLGYAMGVDAAGASRAAELELQKLKSKGLWDVALLNGNVKLAIAATKITAQTDGEGSVLYSVGGKVYLSKMVTKPGPEGDYQERETVEITGN